jgi:hypothetical protein
MATIPGGTIDFAYEMFLANQWVDVSADVHAAGDTVPITSGRPNESSGQPDPTRCELVLNNDTDKYSTDNPVGPYYGHIGRNTPIRSARNLAKDAFGRVVANHWNNADTGQAYTLLGAGGSILFSDWQVTGSVGTMSVPVANGLRRVTLPITVEDIDIAASFSLPFTDVLGGQLDAGITLREQGSGRHYYVFLQVTAAEVVQVAIFDTTDGTIVGPVTVAGVTHTSGQLLRLRASIEGHTIRAKAWVASAGEPYAWQLSFHDERITTAGVVGVRVGTSGTNTNVKPVVWSVDNVVVRSMRFSGELSSIKHRWGESDNDRYVVIEASGLSWRMGHGVSPLHSALYRGIIRLAVPSLAYWPAEDGEFSTSLASAVGGTSMYVAGPTKFADYDGAFASGPLPTINGATWTGPVPDYVDTTGVILLRYLMHIPAAGLTDGDLISQLFTAGSAHHWEVKYVVGGFVKLQCWSKDDVLLLNTIATSDDIRDKNIMVSVLLVQNGANIDYTISTLVLGLTFLFTVTGSLAAQTISKAKQVTFSPYGQLTDTVIGHISVRKSDNGVVFDMPSQAAAWAGELAGNRMNRLCAEEGIDFSWRGDLSITPAMGPQRPDTLLNLLRECAEVDLGTLGEPRNSIGYHYRALNSMLNQPSTATLDYAAEHILSPFVPTTDDQLVHNDVTVTRSGGSSATSEIKTGPMSVLDPSQGGIGRYDHTVTVNAWLDSQLPDIATWLTHLGTVVATRYPRVRVNLAVLPDALVWALLDLAVDDRFVINNPRGGQTPNAISQLARGFAEEQTPFSHYLTLNAVPESPYQILVYDGVEARYDTDGSDLTSAINSTVNTFQVDVPSGPLWTTAPADMPILFVISGEVMSVGAIAGTSSPQTFSSVTRSVNGVIKSHIAGAPVELFDPAVAGP